MRPPGRSIRIRVGREINSAALIADGYHARTDGLTSLAVGVGALGVWLGFPLADPIIGLLITVTILGIVWQLARSVLTRMLDGIEPGILEEVQQAAAHVPGIKQVVVRLLFQDIIDLYERVPDGTPIVVLQ